jgi:8-oxo-dGTP diphosphatase
MPSHRRSKSERPAVTVDVVVFGVELTPYFHAALSSESGLKVLLIKRGQPPYKGKWALPGGFVEGQEKLEDAAFRELKEETDMRPAHLEQLYTFGDPKRDPRGHVISVTYMALVNWHLHAATAGDDAADAEWFDWNILLRRMEADELAFDHTSILLMARDRLRSKVGYAPIGFDLMGPKFTLADLQRLYEIVAQRPIDRGNFRRKIHSLGVLDRCGTTKSAGREVAVYRFNKKRYEARTSRDAAFEI